MSSSDFHGKIILIIGPMMSGKTTELIRLVNRYKYANKSVLTIKPRKDKRYSTKEEILTHADHSGIRSSIDAVTIDNLYNIPNHSPESYDVIAIDEGNFFNHDIVSFAQTMANKGKIVIISGLNGDIDQRHFGHLHLLYPMAEEIIHLKSVCIDCGNDASFTFSTYKRKEGEIVVGGSEIYVSLCRKCIAFRRCCDQIDVKL